MGRLVAASLSSGSYAGRPCGDACATSSYDPRALAERGIVAALGKQAAAP